MDYSNVFGQFLSRCSKEVIGTQDRLAENPSLYSDKFNWYIPSWVTTNRNRCVALCLLISIKGFNIINETNLRNRIIERCDQHSNDEEWKKLLTVVKTEPFTVKAVVDSYLQYLGTPEDLFGNTLPMMKKLNRLWTSKEIDQEFSNKGVKPVKTSEYKDKGSRRPNHVVPKFLGDSNERVQNTIEIPLRVNSTNFWSHVKGLEDQTRTIRERKLNLEESERKIQAQISKDRKRLRSYVKSSLNQLKKVNGEEEFVTSMFEKLTEVNSIINMQLYINSLDLIMTEISEERSDLSDALSDSQSQLFQTYYKQFAAEVDLLSSAYNH